MLRTTSVSSCCPDCGQASHHVHSRYVRRLRDLPYQGRATWLHFHVRKYFCRNPDCSRSVFCERLPDLAPRYAHCSSRLQESQRALGLALGGEPGSRLADKLGMPISGDTLLRRIMQSSPPTSVSSQPTPTVLGVDDWALCKGQHYGTILVDLQRNQVIELLPGRDGAALTQWLLDHPGVEIISRDRASAYSQAAQSAAPDAMQVADRRHSLKNVREMLERFFERHRDKIKIPFAEGNESSIQPQDSNATHSDGNASEETAGDCIMESQSDCPKESTVTQQQSACCSAREQRFQEVRRRHQKGDSIHQIARELKLSRNAVRRYLRQDFCPDWRPGQTRRSKLDGHTKWIDEQIQIGRIAIAELHRDLQVKGYTGSVDAVRRFVSKRMAVLGKPRQRRNAAQPRSPPIPSARNLSFEIIRRKENRKPEEQQRVDKLRAIDTEFAEMLTITEHFIGMIRKEEPNSLTQWLQQAESATSVELRSFAKGIGQDEAVVNAAITQPWSNGQVEGQVNKLKVIKRHIVGRARFTLLRQRVLYSN